MHSPINSSPSISPLEAFQQHLATKALISTNIFIASISFILSSFSDPLKLCGSQRRSYTKVSSSNSWHIGTFCLWHGSTTQNSFSTYKSTFEFSAKSLPWCAIEGIYKGWNDMWYAHIEHTIPCHFSFIMLQRSKKFWTVLISMHHIFILQFS